MNQEKIQEARIMLCHYLASLAKEKGLTTYKIAEITGFKQPNVHRMLSGRYAPSLDNFIKLCDAIQTYVFIIDKNADDDLAVLMKNRWIGKANQS
jgi:transcriptional regulator with XRE-family HTH domain